jgi:hypothetical protein
MNTKRIMIGCLAAGMAWMWCPLAASAGENYYVAMLAWRQQDKRTHAFALFLKTGEEAGGKHSLHSQVLVPFGPLLEERSRTNLPAHLNLAEVLHGSRSIDASVTMQGPYPIAKDLYDRALRRHDHLTAAAARISGEENKGLTRYLDARTDSDMNLHIAEESLYLLVVRGFEPWVQPPGKAPDWLRDRMRLEIGEMR